MDFELLASIVPVDWVPDKLAPQDVKPRHIGRIVSFDLMTSDDPADYSSERVMGTLEGIVGNELIVSGEYYSYANMQNLKTWRRKIKNDR